MTEIMINGADSSQFEVIDAPAIPIGPFASATFYIKFSPASIGFKTATVSITSDDADKNPYEFTITGTGEML